MQSVAWHGGTSLSMFTRLVGRDVDRTTIAYYRIYEHIFFLQVAAAPVRQLQPAARDIDAQPIKRTNTYIECLSISSVHSGT